MYISAMPPPQPLRASSALDPGQITSRIPVVGLREYILSMAASHCVVYTETPTDSLANTITRLSDDDVQLDHIERLLIALRRAGVVSRAQMIELLGNYMDEAIATMSPATPK